MNSFTTSVVFLVCWSTVGWVAGAFFHRMRYFQMTRKVMGRLSPESDGLVTLVVMFVLVVLASSADGAAAVPPEFKAVTFVLCPLCIVLAYRRSAAGHQP